MRTVSTVSTGVFVLKAQGQRTNEVGWALVATAGQAILIGRKEEVIAVNQQRKDRVQFLCPLESPPVPLVEIAPRDGDRGALTVLFALTPPADRLPYPLRGIEPLVRPDQGKGGQSVRQEVFATEADGPCDRV